MTLKNVKVGDRVIVIHSVVKDKTELLAVDRVTMTRFYTGKLSWLKSNGKMVGTVGWYRPVAELYEPEKHDALLDEAREARERTALWSRIDAASARGLTIDQLQRIVAIAEEKKS